MVRSKGAEELFKLICEVLRDKGVDINQTRFNGLDGTNAMSGEISGLQRWFRHLVLHSKYTNCRNDQLLLVFVHLLPKYKTLMDVDAKIICLETNEIFHCKGFCVWGCINSSHRQKKLETS